jgi:hypothetical protein
MGRLGYERWRGAIGLPCGASPAVDRFPGSDYPRLESGRAADLREILEYARKNQEVVLLRSMG